ncbi:MAG: hypothetical protein DRN91_06640 [Candidatus Alkanophagales archaeon]|nr:MAG: hypothetical protein DRN91_06640 [Candidatus Alkanophagales archaeon]
MDESVEEQMPKIKHTELHINLDARIDRNFPIRHILFLQNVAKRAHTFRVEIGEGVWELSFYTSKFV